MTLNKVVGGSMEIWFVNILILIIAALWSVLLFCRDDSYYSSIISFLVGVGIHIFLLISNDACKISNLNSCLDYTSISIIAGQSLIIGGAIVFFICKFKE